jgi:hypothetical protein
MILCGDHYKNSGGCGGNGDSALLFLASSHRCGAVVCFAFFVVNTGVMRIRSVVVVLPASICAISDILFFKILF